MAERELEKLKCYACNGKVCQMCYPCNKDVCQINSCQFKEWRKVYKEDLESYISSDATLPNVKRHYSDPDTSYCKGRDHSFFCDLVKFLNKREKSCSDILQGNFKYRFMEGEGIEVSGTYSKGREMQPFYLRSDQFGFSAPTNEKAHPYDLYIAKHENKDEAIEQVIEWISMSRTIGGSFLWPRPFYDEYNLQRGGKITSNRRYYIQDRVDLTLWEIKNWYNRKDILERCSTEENFGHWMRHFKNFETYVNYFMFKYESKSEFDFVDKSYNPINIITGKSDAPVRGPQGENPKPEITESMKLDSLETMLNTLNDKITKRSIKMTTEE